MDMIKKIKNYTYNERHCLGEGSFGKVYEGRSDEGQQVAIKKVEQKMISKDPYLRSSLETQISIMKKLKHQNIVKLHDVVLTTNSIYLIMEFCAGGDLKRYCRNKKLSEDEATMIIKQICSGFQEIVKKGIIHRDLKPANILVHEGIFKICDFGFAKFFTDTSRMARTCVGTPIYMSPQVLNQKSYTNKTDIWSLGTLFFELMFGKLPFYGVTQEQLYRNIVKGPLMIPNCSNFTYNLLKGMLEIDENKRYDWNKLFQLFQIERIFEGNGIAVEEQKQVRNQFYKEHNRSQKKRKSTSKQKQKISYNNHSFRENNFLKYEQVQDRNISPPQRQRNLKYLAPQRKPKNPLAFQNMSNQNISEKKNHSFEKIPNQKNKVKQKNESQENCRFFYFCLIELIVNPLSNSQSYPNFISALYKKTRQLYCDLLEKQKPSIYAKVLASQLQELKSIEEEIPKSADNDFRKYAQSVLRESKGTGDGSIMWIERLLNKNYSYK